MNNPSPMELLPSSTCTIIRHESYGSTGSNQIEIIRSIKANYDSGHHVKAFIVAVHDNPTGSSQEQELAFLVEYTDDYMELFDQHSMSINRRPRESEVLSMLRTLVQLGFGDRLFFCTKRVTTKVFQQPPLVIAKVFKSMMMKSLLPHWHTFTSVNNKLYDTYPKSIFKEKEWDKVYDLSKSSINDVELLSVTDFDNTLAEGDEVTVGFVGRSFKQWVFVCRRGRKAFMTFCDERTVQRLYYSIIGKYNMKAFGDFVKEDVIVSHAQRLISVNQNQFIVDFTDSNHEWLFNRVIDTLHIH
ncbi:hypothetical protein AB6D11_19130 [Vibrio splendidus]